MKRALFLMLLGLGYQTGFSQIQYSDEGFHTPRAERTYTIKTAGQQFMDRMEALYTQSKPEYQLQTEYNQYIKSFIALAQKNPNKKERVLALGEVMQKSNNQMYNQAGFRARVYEITHPLYLAMEQNWGKEVVEMALAEAYVSLYEFLTVKAVDYPALKSSVEILKENELLDRSEGTCTYTVKLSDEVARDKVSIYFSDFGSYRRLARNFDESKLLQGPVPYWQDEKASSQTVREMLDAYAQNLGSPVKYVYAVNTEKGKKRYSTELPKGMKWFVWVFRNDRVYYHYMIEPCGFENLLEVLHVEEAPLEAVGDPDAYNFD